MTAVDYLLAGRLRASDTTLVAWSSVPDTGLVSMLARQGFDAVALDMQHGGHTEQTIWTGVEAVVVQRKPAIVRVPVGRFDMASRALDFGADAVIAPMINSVADAERFAEATKFPPVGLRSWGPTRAVALRGVPGGQAYLDKANGNTLALAMIETRAAFDAVDRIVAVDGIDGVFVGPADFSIGWTDGATYDPKHEPMMEAVAAIAAAAGARGKVAGIFAADPAMAPRYVAMGYALVAVGFDHGVVKAGADAVLAAATGA